MTSFFYNIKAHIPRSLIDAIRPIYHFFLAFWAALFYGFPSRRMFVIGVTGTKGKTTTVHLLHHVLASSGARVASLSSLGMMIGENRVLHKTKMTMPGRMAVQKFLHDARKKKSQYAILEVTSEGIRQFRHRFIRFEIAVMTNIHPEHIESHGSFEKYLRAKLDLFWRLEKNASAVVNQDDPTSPRFLASVRSAVILYSQAGISILGKTTPIRHLAIEDDHIEFDMGSETILAPLVGDFNVPNILAVSAVALSRHLAPDVIARSIASFPGVPGRMEYISRAPVSVIVDYAHTPDSLRAVYSFLKPRTSGKFVCVLGAAGGGRDSWKRPEFGRIAGEYCSHIILTNEDPYDEDPSAIIGEIQSGIPREVTTRVFVDRREAIREALTGRRAGDTVIITGKGAETAIMGPGGSVIPWDEREIIRAEVLKGVLDKNPDEPQKKEYDI